MNNERFGAFALITATILIIITMAFHPTGHDLLDPARSERMAVVMIAVHTLGLLSLPLFAAGGLAVTRRLGSGALATTGFIHVAFGLVAAMIAAAASGFIAPPIAVRILEGGEREVAWRTAFSFNGLVNQGFAAIFVVAFSIAILLWSIAALQTGRFPRTLGIYGGIVAPVIVIAMSSGHVGLDVHGFGAIMVAQTIWFVVAAIVMVRAR